MENTNLYTNNYFSVTGVNDYDFLFSDTDPGGAITFNNVDFIQCRISFIKSKFIQGYTTRVSSIGEGDLDITCMTDKELFALDNSGSTYVELTVSELSDKAIINLSFSLFSMRDKNVLTKENITLELNQLQLSQLLQN